MRTATAEDIATLEMLALDLERAHTRRVAAELERDGDLRAVELELARAVSLVGVLVGDSAACALSARREILETGHAARLPVDEIGQRIDASHERVEDALETLAIASFHWKWDERPKAAYTCETSHVPDSGSVLQHPRVFVTVAHE